MTLAAQIKSIFDLMFLILETSLYEKNFVMTFNFFFFEKSATFLEGSNPVALIFFF